MDAITLLANKPDGSKRTAVLRLDDESYSVRSKLYQDDDRSIIQYRAWLDALGLYHHIYVEAETGAVLAVTTGTQDGDAYERAKQELHRRGIDL
jgi:hypothetical protein